MIIRILGGAAVTTGLCAALLTLPALHHSSSSMASRVRQALEEVHTWHLRGWKLQNGKPIPWEVWGRRSPFLYREQVGPDLVLDDGRQRTSLFAPLTRLGWKPTPGIVLKTPSMTESENVRWSYQQMVTMWRTDLKPFAETPEGMVFNFPESGVFIGGDRGSMTDLLYTVDRSTCLPVHYEARLGRGDAKQTIAMLTADYNAPIPDRLIDPPSAPAGYQTYDTTQPAAPQRLENAVTVQGITVQAMPLLMDEQGNVLLRIKGWLGNRLIDRNNPAISLGIAADRWADADHHIMRTPANTDDQGRPYTEVFWDGIQYGSSERLMLLVPAEPLSPGSALPTKLMLHVTATMSMSSRLSGTMGMGDSTLSTHHLMLVVPVPAPTTPNMAQGAFDFLDRDWQHRIHSVDGQDDLTAAMDGARANFYSAVIDHRNPDRVHLTRAAYWTEKYLEHANAYSGKQLQRYFLARLYHILGNNSRARQLLQETVDDTHSPADSRSSSMTSVQFRKMEADDRHIYESNRRSAEEALRTWARD
jgi:hypothetical protein